MDSKQRRASHAKEPSFPELRVIPPDFTESSEEGGFEIENAVSKIITIRINNIQKCNEIFSKKGDESPGSPVGPKSCQNGIDS